MEAERTDVEFLREGRFGGQSKPENRDMCRKRVARPSWDQEGYGIKFGLGSDS
ncbi:hypothetical protein HMPREF9374_1545 [Desmospora sp. 8437]|nr:hypothetical protein HMPREF9374_1545 [Desmospora sp. 8437]